MDCTYKLKKKEKIKEYQNNTMSMFNTNKKKDLIRYTTYYKLM